MMIIPAIDVLDGVVVRLQQGRYASASSYPFTVVEAAQRVARAGLNHLHLVDLGGARVGASSVGPLVAALTRETELHVDVGGGIRTVEHASAMISAGAHSVCLGSIAIDAPSVVDAIAREIGIDRVIIALDAKDGIVRTHGWEVDGSLRLDEAVATYVARGYLRIMVTDIGRDGMMSGPAIETYRTLCAEHPAASIIASGGVRSINDCRELSVIGCAGVVIGKAWLDGVLDITQAGSLTC